MIKKHYIGDAERQRIKDEQLAAGMKFFSDHTDMDRRKCLVFMTAEEDEIYQAKAARIAMQQTDMGMGRVTEDLVNLLVLKGIIAPEDLPPEAMGRITDRQALREKL